MQMSRSLRMIVLIALIAGVSRAAAAVNSFALPADRELAGAMAQTLQPPAVELPNAERFAAHVKQMTARFEPIDYDPAMRAKALGDGVEPALKYVRDEIRFEAYPGVMRGARGTYIARAGNAPDRALLLAELLKEKKIETRFAVGHLSAQNAEALYNRMFEPAAKAGAGEATVGGTPATTDSRQFVSRVRARALRDYATILNVLGDRLPAAATPKAQVIEEISDHVWVQANVGGQWTDLDTAFADSTVGKSYCAATTTSPAIPAGLHQRVTIRVVAEMLDGNAVKKETALEVTRPVAELLEKQIFLLHSPLSGMKGLGGAAGSGGRDSWAPLLWINGELNYGKSVLFKDSTDSGAAGGAVGGAIDALDITPKADASPTFVGESLEIDLELPGGKHDISRRMLSDRGGAVWRAAPPDAKTLSPLERDARGPVAAQQILNLWLSGGKHDMPGLAEALGSLSSATRNSNGSFDPNAPPEVVLAEQLWPLALQNLLCVLWADHAFVPALNDDPAVRVYDDAPRVLLFELVVRKEQDIQSGIDLHRDRLRVVVKDPATAVAAAAKRKIWYGALEGALEHEVVATQGAVIAEKGAIVSSTSALLGPQGAVCLTPADRDRAEGGTRENVARLTAALAAGDTLVVPRGALAQPEAGWWAISPGGDVRAVWGPDLNGGRVNVGGGYVRQSPGMYGGSSGPSTNYVDPNTGNSYTYKRAARGGGNEDATILVTVSLPGGITLRLTVGKAVVGAVAAAAAVLIEQLLS
jgi:hypothetical protein